MTEASGEHERWMRRALTQAEAGLYTAAPNPRVGCVIVRDGECVGEGAHLRSGEAHAEVHALQAAGDRAWGADVYVTLEPCSHMGRTPPCADALIAAGVRRVVVAVEDPDPRVSGRGLARLRAAGIEVLTGVLNESARELNRGFLSRIERGRPWVRMKVAASVDGRTATASGESQWITGAEARTDVHHWRARSDAILTGSGTVLADDCQLTARGIDSAFNAPLRVVLDSTLRSGREHTIMDKQAPTLIVHAGAQAEQGAFPDHVDTLALASGARVDLEALLRELGERDVNEVFVEAGARLNGALLAADLVDELLLYQAPVLLGNQGRALADLEVAKLGDAPRWRTLSVDQLGDDVRWRLLRRQ